MVVADADRMVDDQRAPRRRLLSAPGRVEECHERASAAVESGDLAPLDLDLQVVDAQAGGRGQEMLHRLDARAVPPDRRGVVGTADALRGGGDSVGMTALPKDDPRVRRRWRQGHANGLAGVQPDAAHADGGLDGPLVHYEKIVPAIREPRPLEASSV